SVYLFVCFCAGYLKKLWADLDEILGSRFSVFNPRTLRWTMGMVFAINEINKDPDLLQNVTLGYVIYDSCFSIPNTLDSAVSFLEHETGMDNACLIGAAIATSGSTLSMTVSRMLSLYFIPQVFSSTCKCLSDKKRFPSFLRTIPSDTYQASAFAHLVHYFDWLYVGALAADDDFGISGMSQFLLEIKKFGHCVAFEELIPKVKDMKSDRAIDIYRIILIYCGEPDLVPFAQEIKRRNITGKTWLATQPWVTSPLLSTQHYSHIFEGNIGFAQRRGHIPGFKDFLTDFKPSKNESLLNDFLLELWERTFGCTWLKESGVKKCTGQEQLDQEYSPFTDVAQLRITYNTYMAVYSIAHALRGIQKCEHGQGPFINDSCALIENFQPWQLLYYVKNVKFLNNLGELMSFDEHGEPSAFYELINWHKDKNDNINFKLVGSFKSMVSPEKRLVNKPLWSWAVDDRKGPRDCAGYLPPRGVMVGEPSPALSFRAHLDPGPPLATLTTWLPEGEDDLDDPENACFPMPEQFLSFSDPLALTLLVFNLFGITLSFVIGIVMFHHRALFMVDKNTNFRISLLMLLFFLGCFGSIFTFMGRPTDLVCKIRYPIAFTFLSNRFGESKVLKKVSIVLIGLIVIRVSRSKGTLSPLKGWIVIFFNIAVQLMYSITWVVVGGQRVIFETSVQQGSIILECQGLTNAWIYFAFVYLLILILVCLFLAIKAAKLSSVNNDVKYITYGIMACLLVSLAFLPAYNSTRGKFTIIAEIFSVSAITYSHLGCIFMPKCYTILFPT
uniref:Vomeronasal 2, receptor 1 n=1 Tax=Eptatretus burgeri TaxID=7764 RepID=A0A8C4PWC4_EPTBU